MPAKLKIQRYFEIFTNRKWSEVAQSYPTLCDPMDYSPPGSSIHGILQARKLEWVAISFSRGYSQPRDHTQVSHIAGRHFNLWVTREASPIGDPYKKTTTKWLSSSRRNMFSKKANHDGRKSSKMCKYMGKSRWIMITYIFIIFYDLIWSDYITYILLIIKIISYRLKIYYVKLKYTTVAQKTLCSYIL